MLDDKCSEQNHSHLLKKAKVEEDVKSTVPVPTLNKEGKWWRRGQWIDESFDSPEAFLILNLQLKLSECFPHGRFS